MSLGRILGSQNGSGARAAALWGHGGLGARWIGGTVDWGYLPSPQHSSSDANLLGEPAVL